MDFFELKLIEKIGDVFARAMTERKYNRYQFIKKWCSSDTCQAVLEFDETLCSQAKSYILRTFEKECEDKLPDTDSDSPLYEDDMYWFGYLLTYWHFLDGTSGKEVLKEYDVCKILDEYDVLHTLSIKTAIEKIREDDRNEYDFMKEMPTLPPHDMVRQVVATMAVEDMYLSKDFIEKMEKIANGEISSEEVRQELIKKYAR